MTSVDCAPAGSPSVPAFPAPACGHHACAPSAFPRDRAGTASSSSARCPPGAAAGGGVGSRTACVPKPVPSAAAAARHPGALTHSGKSWLQADQPAGPPLRIALLPDRPAHSQSPRPGRQKFFPSISFSVAASRAVSASSFFSLRFSSSSAFSLRASESPSRQSATATCKMWRR